MSNPELQQFKRDITDVIIEKTDQVRTDLANFVEDTINPQFDELRGKIVGIKNQMVTKAYLDDKLADFYGDTNVRLRKEDAKVNRLVEMMDDNKLLNKDEVNELDGFQVFPKSNH